MSDAILKKSRRTAFKVGFFSFFLISILIFFSTFYFYQSRSRGVIDGVEKSISQLILVGDTFQIHRDLSSMVDGGLFSGIVLSDLQGNRIDQAGEAYEDLSDKSSYLNFRSGELFFNYRFSISEEGNVVALGHAVRKAPVFEFFTLVLLSMFFLVGAILVLLRSFRQSALGMVDPLVHLSTFLKRVPSDSSHLDEVDLVSFRFREVNDVYSEFKYLWRRLGEFKESENQLVKQQAELVLAHQVSHDIRSPLSALEMMSSNLKELPEDKRVVIRNAINRIRDIANTLSSKRGQADVVDISLVPDNPLEVVLLSPAIEVIITEKRLEVRNHLGVQINFDQTRLSYGLFSRIVLNDFKRVLSNLINNAVEALPNERGQVNVLLEESQDSRIRLSISDNGSGIPDELITKLGTRGLRSLKSGGSGLGIAHAKECVEAWGGQLKIDSEVGVGTVVSIYLPKENPPAWFVPKLELKYGDTVVILDDDQSIHQIWKGRFDSANFGSHLLVLEHMSSTKQFRKFYGERFVELDQAVFLIDYEIIGQHENGIDLIEQLGIQRQSILVTSRYEEPLVRQRCERIGVRLIPKPMSGFVPIEISK